MNIDINATVYIAFECICGETVAYNENDGGDQVALSVVWTPTCAGCGETYPQLEIIVSADIETS